jgi:hypothetical protein
VRFVKAHTEQGARLGVVWPDGVVELARADAKDAVLAHLAEAGHVAAAIRPDTYLYGTVAAADAIPSFVDGLLRQLAGAAPTDPAEPARPAGTTGSTEVPA